MRIEIGGVFRYPKKCEAFDVKADIAFKNLVDVLRAEFICLNAETTVVHSPFPEAEYSAGRRFYSNQIIKDMLLCHATLNEFHDNPAGWIWAALSTAATLDYHYEYDKEWLVN